MVEGKRLRLFLALELPDAWRVHLAREAQALEAEASGFCRWVHPSLMHITLVFLGGQPSDALPAIEDAVTRTGRAVQPFQLRLSQLGCFGGRRSIRVVWSGAEDRPRGALSALHAGLTQRLGEREVGFERAPVRPHITLARARRGGTSAQSEAMHRALAVRNELHAAPASLVPADCLEVVLMRSDLKPTGPIYTPILRAKLGSGEP